MENMGYQPEELIPIVAELAAAYTGYEHSSVTYETAEMLMEAALYCIHECVSDKGNALAAGPVSAKKAYEAGFCAVVQKTKELQEIYNRLIGDFQDYGLTCLRDVIVQGIPAFLLRYDVKFAPQETLLTLDYPVLKDLSGLSGVDAVLEYVRCVCLEQRFLKKFDPAYILEILRACAPEYETLLENICAVSLPSLLAHMTLQKPLSSKGFSVEEYETLERMFAGKPAEETEAHFAKHLNSLIEYSFGHEEDLEDYLGCAVGDLAKRVSWNGANHCLERIFLL